MLALLCACSPHFLLHRQVPGQCLKLPHPSLGPQGTEAKQARIYPEANPQPWWGPITRRLIVRKLARHRVRSTHALGGTRDLDLLPFRDEDDSTNILLSGPLGPALAQSYPEQFCCPRLGSWDLPGCPPRRAGIGRRWFL